MEGGFSQIQSHLSSGKYVLVLVTSSYILISKNQVLQILYLKHHAYLTLTQQLTHLSLLSSFLFKYWIFVLHELVRIRNYVRAT